MADINDGDAQELGVTKGDYFNIYNQNGSITVWANPTMKIQPGAVQMYMVISKPISMNRFLFITLILIPGIRVITVFDVIL